MIVGVGVGIVVELIVVEVSLSSWDEMGRLAGVGIVKLLSLSS